MPEFPIDPEANMPWLPAQRCRGRVAVIREPDELVGEILVLPNLIVWFNLYENDTRVGGSRVVSPQIARLYMDEHVPLLVEHVTECDGEECGHAGHRMEVVSCEG